MLNTVSFSARPGTTTAIIGSTGAGKTTLVNLIRDSSMPPAAWSAWTAWDVRDLDPDLLWGRIGLVPQRPYLFSGRSRPICGSASPTPPMRSCGTRSRWLRPPTSSAACRTGWSPTSPRRNHRLRGPATTTGDRPGLGAPPEIYVFDDAFSALDVSTDAALRAALAHRTGELPR